MTLSRSAVAFVLSLALPCLLQAEEPKAAAKGTVQTLFDGKTLDGWRITDFGGEGEVVVKDSQIIMSMGQPLTGITWKEGDKLPKDNFEITLQAMKRKGDDFFCGLTFPVRESHATFVVGGWAGSVVGLSNINGQDASENETTKYENFKKNAWYAIRVRVTGGKIECWINDEQKVDVELKDNKISTRIEVDPNKPLGVCCYNVEAALKDIKLRRLEEKK